MIPAGVVGAFVHIPAADLAPRVVADIAAGSEAGDDDLAVKPAAPECAKSFATVVPTPAINSKALGYAKWVPGLAMSEVVHSSTQNVK